MDEKMHKGCWKIDANDEACYVDIEEDEDDDNNPNKVYSQWCDLPDLLLEEIFSYLNIKERYYASLVCWNWYQAFYLPNVWSNFLVEDNTLTHSKFNYYSGWQYVIDHLRTQQCFKRIGGHIKGLNFRPVHSFNNLYQFMSLISWYMERNARGECEKSIAGIGRRIQHLKYLFPCNMASPDDPEGVKLFGTGGQLLAALRRLMACLTELKTLSLIDLMLERYEAKHLLDEVLVSCGYVLKSLNLVNVTMVHCPIMHAGLFFNLKILIISPQNVDDDILTLLADSKLRHLHLYQNRYTPQSISLTPCSAKGWRLLKQTNKSLLVHLRCESTSDGEVLLQPDAPVYSIVYQSPKTKISTQRLIQIVDMYKDTLTMYGHEGLPRFLSPKSFNNRVDGLLLLMARECKRLNTLIIREKISTATVLLIARFTYNLKHFYVRRNHVIIRCDWPKSPDWSDEFYLWLKNAARSYESTEIEVSQILDSNWKLLSDNLFRKITITVR